MSETTAEETDMPDPDLRPGDIPSDDAIESMHYLTLRSVASMAGLRPWGNTKDKIRKDLSRWRDRGGRLMRCQRCDYIWVYQGTAEYVVNCPNCYTSLMRDKHTLYGPVEVGESDKGVREKLTHIADLNDSIDREELFADYEEYLEEKEGDDES